MWFVQFGLTGLFFACFISATLIPFPSEAVVIGMYALNYPVIPVLIIATIANFLGGLTNYYIGYKGNTEKLIQKFKLNQVKLNQWQKRLSKWGIFLGLFSWLPFIGDPMIAAFGFFRVKFIPLAIMMLIGKFLRYLFLTLIYFEIF